MNTERKTRERLNASDFLGSKYLRKEDVTESRIVTIKDVWAEQVANGGRRKLVVAFEQFEKPLVLNSTNTKALLGIFRSDDASQWRGKVTLFVDSQVEYAGRIVGGLRIQPVAVAQVDDAQTSSFENGRASQSNLAA